MTRFIRPTPPHETLSNEGRGNDESVARALDAGERSTRMMNRRSILRGAGLATGAGLVSALMKPLDAKAHGNGWGNGWGGGWGGGQNRIDVVLGLLGAIETLDPEEIALWLANDVLYENTGLPDALGKTAVAEFFGSYASIFDSFTTDVINIMSHGDLVCTERLSYFQVSQDSPVGQPGAEFTMKVAAWHEVQCGKVVRWSDYWDTRAFIDALGIPLPTA